MESQIFEEKIMDSPTKQPQQCFFAPSFCFYENERIKKSIKKWQFDQKKSCLVAFSLLYESNNKNGDFRCVIVFVEN